MQLRFVGLAHIVVYRGSGEPWEIGDAREVDGADARHLLAHGGFEIVGPIPAIAPDGTAEMVTAEKPRRKRV